MHSRAIFVSTSILFVGLLPGESLAYDPPLLCAHPRTPNSGDLFGPELTAALEPAPMCGPVDPAVYAVPRLDDGDARRALRAARALAESGRPNAAILRLRIVSEAFPELADRVALEEAEYRMAAGPDPRACDAYERAAESVHRSIALRARIGMARCLLTIADRRGISSFDELRRRYPALPQEQELDLLLGAAHETWGEPALASQVYRRLDLMHPGSPQAATARERIQQLRAQGIDVRELTPIQQVDRAERLVRSGPMDAARAEVARLRAIELPTHLARQLARSAARLARVEGRWEDANRLLREAQGLPGLDPEEQRSLADQALDLERAAESREADDARRRVRALMRGRPITAQPTARLFAALRMAARAGLRGEVNEVLSAIRQRSIPPGLRFDAAILATGTGSDEHVAALLESARQHPLYGIAARYHHARALERLGQVDEARAEYLRIVAEDSTRLPYYAMWSRQRLRATALVEPREPLRRLASLGPAACDVGPFSPSPSRGSAKSSGLGRFDDVSCRPGPPSNPFTSTPSTPTDAADEEPDPLEEADAFATAAEVGSNGTSRPNIDLSDGELIELLEPVAQEYATGFPWLQRAVALIRLGERTAATDELHETYTAWQDSRGRRLRAGLLGVLLGSTPPRHRMTGATWRDRRRLSVDAQRVLARVSAALGDHGLAIRFDGGFGVAGPRPRAYESIVEEVTARYGIEPELLFAVMRVESVYNPRIISYAGAIGLAQIMPRTGRLIAQSLGRDDFTIDQLLDPEINLEFAAWYLSSLIERFDGRVPLAVASYNGGPHNVRRWLRDHSDDMPLDAFLERIPFSQTHRYVRRVLTHYEAYKAQRGATLAQLHTRLPEPHPDPIAF